jgi:hypothetical protein
MRKNVEYNLFGEEAIYYKGKNRSCRGNASKARNVESSAALLNARVRYM